MDVQLPDDGLRTETCRSSFSVLMCKFYISALVGIIDRLCGLVVGVSGYRYRGPRFDPQRYQIF